MTYSYDGDGDRVEKSNGTLYWYGLGGAVLEETYLSGGVKNDYVFFGGKRIARHTPGGTNYLYVEDYLGSSRVIVNGSGGKCYDADFYPYGGEVTFTDSCAQNYKFAGKERDAETGNDNFGARYYSSSFGRFLSPDWSAIPAPIPYADPTNPQSLNLYQYVANNPETFADIGGHLLCGGACRGLADKGGSGAEFAGDIEPDTSEDATLNAAGATQSEINAINQLRKIAQQQASQGQQTTAPAQQQISNNYKPYGGSETVAEIAGRVCGETCGMRDSKTENESLANARDKIAHVRLNGIKKWGNNAQKHASLAAPVMHGAGYRASLQAVKNAVREGLGGVDPTKGAIFYNMRTPGQAAGMRPFQGESVHTVSGPYISPSKYNYIVTYGPEP